MGAIYFIVYYILCSIILLLILSFHIMRINNNQHQRTTSLKLCKHLTLVHVSYLILILPLIRFIVAVIFYMIPNIANSSSCHIMRTFTSSIFFGIQAFIHLFIAMRSRLNNPDITLSNNIWFKIGLMLISVDIFSVMFIISGHAFDIIEIMGQCYVENVSFILIIVNILSAIFINLYSLFVFVIPLRKYVKWEEETTSNGSNDGYLKTLINKIVLYSSIMIISTITISVLIGAVNNLSAIISPIDNIIDCYCIILQFKDIQSTDIKSKYLWKIISFFQCGFCVKICCCSKIESIKKNEINLSKMIENTNIDDDEEKNDNDGAHCSSPKLPVLKHKNNTLPVFADKTKTLSLKRIQSNPIIKENRESLIDIDVDSIRIIFDNQQNTNI